MGSGAGQKSEGETGEKAAVDDPLPTRPKTLLPRNLRAPLVTSAQVLLRKVETADMFERLDTEVGDWIVAVPGCAH